MSFFKKPELKISVDFLLEQTILSVMSRLTGLHQIKT